MSDGPENPYGSRPPGENTPRRDDEPGATQPTVPLQPTQPPQNTNGSTQPTVPIHPTRPGQNGNGSTQPTVPLRPQQSVYAPPAASGYLPPASGLSAPPYNSTYGSPPQPPTGSGDQPAQVGAAPKGQAKRGATVGIIAALAVGALVGGVAGAGVTAVALTAAQGTLLAGQQSGPANITVNDADDATTITAVAAQAGPSVVTISVADGSNGSGGSGSGVILSADGYIVTNTHVVTLDGATGAPTVSVQTSDGRLYPAEIVGTDPISDLAVIKVDSDTEFQPAEFADSSKLNVGDTAIAIGAPLGLANTVTNGIVSALNRSITVASAAAPDTEEAPDSNQGEQGPFDFWQFDTPDQQQQAPTATSTIALSVIQTDAAINPGNSGGALLDDEGRVIGINVAIASAGSGGSSTAGSIGVGFAITANLAKRIANEIIETGEGSHGLLGASVSDATDTESTVVGARIENVSADGAAANAGLRAGDIITSFDGLPITGSTDLTAQVRALAAGSDATVTYVRDGATSTADVTLGAL
ncbi:S1C family serine protease [Marisediminicola senii]|uniref:S1C family serine protease n=1 Tax=Marisediminicola senii TaxID=2711233 RepID=UPI0013EDB09F|nr:trypsin-like peptidase domain-containing protein [Marisediminicola senii]